VERAGDVDMAGAVDSVSNMDRDGFGDVDRGELGW
jgi:hypothetical protein